MEPTRRIRISATTIISLVTSWTRGRSSSRPSGGSSAVRSASAMFKRAVQDVLLHPDCNLSAPDFDQLTEGELIMMLREEQPGRYVLKVCRTLSCALAGGMDLHKNLCSKLKLDPKKHGLQTTEDGKFSIEFAECLASCGTGPVMMCNDVFYEAVDEAQADKILGGCQE